MSVGTFIQPNFEAQTGTEYKTAVDNAIAALARIGAAFAPHEQAVPNMTVRVDAGVLMFGVALTEIAAQSTGTITAPVTNPRIDRVVVDAITGAVSVVTGAEAASPSPPVIPSGKLPIAQVALATSTTEITNTLITDERIGGGGSGGIPVGGTYYNETGVDPATDLGYGTWLIKRPIGPFVSQYPPTHNDTYVKASGYNAYRLPHYATDPAKSLTGNSDSNSWKYSTPSGSRFHIDLGAAKIITRIYYENFHNTGDSEVKYGIKDFTFWGSNNAGAFAELTYGTDTNWTQLTTETTQMLQHAGLNEDKVDPRYITVFNSVAYRYYAFKFANAWIYTDGVLGIRRVVLQNTLCNMWVRTA